MFTGSCSFANKRVRTKLLAPLCVVSHLMTSDHSWFASKGLVPSPDMEDAIFVEIKKSWEEMGERCPWHSVLTGYAQVKDISEHDKDVFYQTGRDDVAQVFQGMGGFKPGGKALD